MRRFILRVGIFMAIFLFIIISIEIFAPYNPKGFIRAQLIKDKLLSDSNRDSSIVLLGGSSVVFGYNCDTVGYMIKDYSIINYGLHAGIGLKFNIDDCQRFLKSGDVLIVAPEYSHFADDNAYGGLPLANVVYLNPCEYFPLLNRQQILTVLNNTPMHLIEKITYSARHFMGASTSDVYSLNSINQYGDAVAHYSLPNKILPEATANQGGELNDDFLDYFIFTLDSIKNKGVKVVMYPPPISRSLYKENEDWINLVAKQLSAKGYPFVVTPDFCCYPDTMFYDTHYHLNGKAAIIHSRRLALLLLNNAVVN